MEAHIRSEYPGHVARTVRDIKTSEIHFGHVTFAMPSALGGNAVIVWGYGERLARIEIRDGRWAVTCAVHVNVCNVRRFALDRNGDIVLPTADEGLLILDGMTLQLKRSIPLAEGLDFENIHYFPGRSLYMAHGGEPKIHLLSEAFEIIGSSHLQDYAMELCANIDESLVSILSSDNEAFHALYHFSAAQELTHIETFYFSGLGASFELAFSENGFVVTYEDTVVVYRFTQGKVEQCWQLPLAQYPSPYGMSFAIYLDENTLLVGKGKQLLRIDAQIPKIVGVATLDLSKHVMNLYLDATREFLIVRGGGLYLLKLDAIPWEEPPQDPS